MLSLFFFKDTVGQLRGPRDEKTCGARLNAQQKKTPGTCLLRKSETTAKSSRVCCAAGSTPKYTFLESIIPLIRAVTKRTRSQKKKSRSLTSFSVVS